MLSDYDEFVGLLKHHGDLASGVAVVEPSHSASLLNSSSIRSMFATAVVVTHAEATQLCAGSSSGAASSIGGGSSSAAASLPPSLPFIVGGTDAAASTQRDTILFLVNDGGAVGGGKQLPWFAGFMSESSLRSESTDVPMSVLVPVLFGTIRATMSSSSSVGGGGGGGGMLLTVDTTPPPGTGAQRISATTPSASSALTAPVLLVDIRGSIRKQFCIHLLKLDVASERRRAAHALLTRALLTGHTSAMITLERERRARADADDALARAHALLLEHGGDAAAAAAAAMAAGRNAQGGKDAAKAKIQRPTSIINPQQKGPTKRPRGVKLN